MADIVVTLPKSFGLDTWLEEGDAPGEPWSGNYYDFTVSGRPSIAPGERVYVVYDEKLIGYAPLIDAEFDGRRTQLVRAAGAQAVTIEERIPGFRGYRYRWWDLDSEVIAT